MEKLIVGVMLVALFAVIIALSVGAQMFCTQVYAPWLLGTTDVQAISYYCKPNPIH